MFTFLDYPYPPTVNQAYATGRDLRRFKSKSMKLYEKECEFWDFKNRMLLNSLQIFLQREMITSRKFLQLDVYFSVPKSDIWTQKGILKKNDVNNRIKPLFDSLTKTLGIDDHVFNCGIVTKVWNTTKLDRKTIIKGYVVPILSLEEAINDLQSR